jgi:hypothetical protein
MNQQSQEQNDAADLEIYAYYCESVEKNIDRRYGVNKFNFSIAGAIGISYGFLKAEKTSITPENSIFLVKILLVSCIIFSIVWVVQILRFREVSRIKYEVLLDMEKFFRYRPFTSEMERLSRNSGIADYTNIEVLFPILILFLAISGLFL